MASDEVVVGRVLQGDNEAYTELVDRYRNAVFAIAYHRLRNFDDAQDVAQETFLHAYNRLPQLREAAKFGNWLRRIAVNQCLTRQRQQTGSEHIEATPLEPSHHEASDLRLTIEQALSCLSDDSRLILILFYMDSYSMQDIAAFLEVPVTTIKSRLRDARARLKKEMQEMVKETMQEHALSDEFTRKIGKLITSHNTLVEIQLEPGETPPIFTAYQITHPANTADAVVVVTEQPKDGKVGAITWPPTFEIRYGMEVGQEVPGFDFHADNEDGATALSYAATNGRTETVRALLDKGADVNAVGDGNDTALIYAASYKRVETVKLLLEHGADPNIVTSWHNTALMYAAWSGKPEMVAALLEKGADPSIKTPQGRTALTVAEEMERDYHTIAAMLREKE